jgi:hypothetical protein
MDNKRTGLFFLFLITVVFCSFYLLPLYWAAGGLLGGGCGHRERNILVTGSGDIGVYEQDSRPGAAFACQIRSCSREY